MKTLLGRLDLSYFYAFLSQATLSFTFVFYIILARILGPDHYGVFASAAALAGILSFFIQFGLPAFLGREVAAQPQEGPRLTLTFLLLEGLNSLLVLLLLFPLAHLLGFQGQGITICYLVIFAEICRSAKQTIRAVFRGLGQFRTESISVTLERFLVVLFAGIVLFLSQDLIWVLTTLVIVRTLDILGLLSYLGRSRRIWSPISFGSLWQSIQMAYPFALSGVLWILYYQIDLLMLKGLAPTQEAGFYSAAYRLIEIFSALPLVIFSVTFTKFARYHATEPDRLPEEIYKSVSLLLKVVLPILLMAGFVQITLVEIIYGQAFAPAVNSLAILLPSLGIKMFGTLVGYFLQATEREKYLPPLLLTTVITNIIANAILIPRFGAVGAALATLLSEIVLAMVSLSIMIRMEKKLANQHLRLIAVFSLLVAAIPSLMLNGLKPAVGVGLVFLSVTMLILVMNRNQFMKR